MTTHTAIHYVSAIEASHNPEIPSLGLSITGSGRIPHSIALFVEDAVLAARLAKAINECVGERREELDRIQLEKQAEEVA